MRATTTSTATSAAATSILRSLEGATLSGTAHVEPAFRVLPHLSSFLSFSYPSSNTTRTIATSATSAAAAGEDVNLNKTITTLPQLSSAMQLAYSSRHYDQVLSLYSQADDRIVKPASKKDPRTAAMTYDCALKACAAAAEARQAQRILSTMWKRGVPVGRVAQGSVLKALCAAGQRQAAFQHIKGIPAARVTTMHCNTVLSACAAAHDTAIGLKVWEFMKRRGVKLDYVSYCEALRVFGAAGNVDNLVNLWENEIQPAITLESVEGKDKEEYSGQSLDNADEEVVLQRKNESTTMVAAAYAGALAAAGHVSLAMAQCESIMDMLGHLLPQELHLAAFELNTRTTANNTSGGNNTGSGGRQTAAPLDNLRSACNAVLHAAVSSHQWSYLRKMVALMTSRGLPPDVITYNALLKAAVKRGEGPQPIHEGIAEMMALGLVPTSATYTLLIEAYALEGDVEGAHTIFNSIVHPDCTAWNAVLRAHAGMGDLTGLGQTFQLMVDQGESFPDESTYIACFEGIATGLRKHNSLLDSNSQDYSATSTGESAADADSPTASSTSSPTSGIEAKKKSAMSVLYQVEHHMKTKNSTCLYKPAVRAALVKAHGALHHTALVWSLLADEYMYNNILSSSNTTTRKNNRIIPTTRTNSITPAQQQGGGPSPSPPTTVHHALPPKPKSAVATPAEIETELLNALSTAITSSTTTKKNSSANISAVLSPRVLNAGIPQLLRSGRVDLVIQLINSLAKAGYCPDSDTYAALITACDSGSATSYNASHNHHSHNNLHQLKPSFARRLLSHMEEQHQQQQLERDSTKMVSYGVVLKPCARVYNALLRVECSRAGVDAALDVIDEMRNKAIQPDSHTWMVLRGCALGHGRSDVADQANYEIRMLKSGSSSEKKKQGSSAPSGDDVLSGAVAAVGVEAAAVVEALQSGERHWKGYYASDEEDEW